MIFEHHALKAPLDTFIESIFYYKDFMPDHSIERVVPTGHLFVLFELDGITRHTYDNETLKPKHTYSQCWVSGMHQNYLSISAHERSEMLVVQFKPYGAYPFFHRPINTLNDQVMHATEIFGDELTVVREQIIKHKNIKDKFIAIEQWLVDKYVAEKAPPVELMNIIENIKTTATGNTAALIKAYPQSQKHLIDQCKKYVGLTPKSLQRVYRFNELLQAIHNKDKIEWAQVSLECGYSDQSHFIKEFKHFCGINPQEFLSEAFHKDEPNFFALDRE